jgi:hypothetical protein
MTSPLTPAGLQEILRFTTGGLTCKAGALILEVPHACAGPGKSRRVQFVQELVRNEIARAYPRFDMYCPASRIRRPFSSIPSVRSSFPASYAGPNLLLPFPPNMLNKNNRPEPGR